MSNPNIDKLVEISKKGVRKEMKIEELLDTTQWIWAGGEIIPPPKPSAPIVNNFNSGEGNIHIALNALKEKYVPVTKRLTYRFGKVWTVDEDAADAEGVLEEAKFINSKVYVLNKNIYSSFLFPELKRSEVDEVDLPIMSGGSLNKGGDNGELIALYNTILMSGGNVTLEAYESNEEMHNQILNQLQKGNLRLTEKEKDRLVLLLKKNAKYQERVALVHEYLQKYNSLPEDEKKPSNVLKKIVDKHDKLNKKKRKVNKDILDHIKEVISGKSEKKSEYYTENVPTTFIHKMDLSHLSQEAVGQLILEKFNKREDREKTKKLKLCTDERKKLNETLNLMKNLMGEYVRITRELEEQVSEWEKESAYWKGRSDIWEKDTDTWKDFTKFWKGKSDFWKGKSDFWKGKSDDWEKDSGFWEENSDFWEEKFNEQKKLVEKLRKTGAPGTTETVGDALGALSGNVTLDTDLTIKINGRPLRELTPKEIVNFFRDDYLLRMLRDSDARTRQQIQAILSTNFTPQQIRQLPAGILFMLGFPVPIRDLVADLDLSNMVRPAIEFATHLRARFEEIVAIIRIIGGEDDDIAGLERLIEGALKDLVSQMNSLTDETTSTQLVRSYGIIDVLIDLFKIENVSRRVLTDIRGLLPDTPASQDIIKSLDNLLEDNGTADLRLAVTRIRGLLPAPPAPLPVPGPVDDEGWTKVTNRRTQQRERNPLLNSKGQPKLSAVSSYVPGPSRSPAAVPAAEPTAEPAVAAVAAVPGLQTLLEDTEAELTRGTEECDVHNFYNKDGRFVKSTGMECRKDDNCKLATGRKKLSKVKTRKCVKSKIDKSARESNKTNSQLEKLMFSN